MKLIRFSQTRWVYTYVVLKRLLFCRSNVERILIDSGNIDMILHAEEWEHVASIIELLEPFFTTIAELQVQLVVL